MSDGTAPLLPPAVSGERHDLPTAARRLSYYTAGPAGKTHERPLLLVHSINAAASAYEVKTLYEHYRPHRPVYALELPGYGFSDRRDEPYLPRTMVDAIHAMTAEIARRHGGGPIDAVALSLSSEFLARACVETPAVFRSLALVSPTGFSRRYSVYGPPESNLGRPRLWRVLTFPLWGGALFRALTRRASIRYFLRRTWGSAAIDEGMAEYDVLTARQPGAHHAPYRFLSGFLFSRDIGRIYDQLSLPVWLTHGVRGDFVDYQQAVRFDTVPNWSKQVFDTGALPHFEAADAFMRGYDAFLEKVEA
jgi:pimeloyl-ACP methyl ester carboxylesterase